MKFQFRFKYIVSKDKKTFQKINFVEGTVSSSRKGVSKYKAFQKRLYYVDTLKMIERNEDDLSRFDDYSLDYDYNIIKITKLEKTFKIKLYFVNTIHDEDNLITKSVRIKKEYYDFAKLQDIKLILELDYVYSDPCLPNKSIKTCKIPKNDNALVGFKEISADDILTHTLINGKYKFKYW